MIYRKKNLCKCIWVSKISGERALIDYLLINVAFKDRLKDTIYSTRRPARQSFGGEKFES